MKSKLLSGITVIMIGLSTPVFADDAHHKITEEKAGQSMCGMPVMDMEAMQAQMDKMQKTMDKIQGTDNMNVKQEFMQQHMQEMHEATRMMRDMMSADMLKGMSGKMPNIIIDPLEFDDE